MDHTVLWSSYPGISRSYLKHYVRSVRPSFEPVMVSLVEVSIRKMCHEDLPFVYSLLVHRRFNDDKAIPNFEEFALATGFHDLSNIVTINVYVAVSETRIVGFGSFSVSSHQDRVCLNDIFVEPAYRRKAVGHQILRRICKWCKRKEYETVFLKCQSLLAAIFFESCGAEVTKEGPNNSKSMRLGSPAIDRILTTYYAYFKF